MRKKILYFGLGLLTGGIVAVMWMQRRPLRPLQPQFRTVLSVVRDTVVVTEPRMTRQRRKAAKKPEAAADTAICSPAQADTSAAYVQRIYEGEDYKAWVSGIDPELDSIAVYRLSAVSAATEAHGAVPDMLPGDRGDKRWHLGVFAGCAVTPRGVEPAIGVGISYSFCSW